MIDPEYARLSLEAGYVAGKLVLLKGDDAMMKWLRKHPWTLTKEDLDTLKVWFIKFYKLPPDALNLTDEEQQAVNGMVSVGIEMQRQYDSQRNN